MASRKPDGPGRDGAHRKGSLLSPELDPAANDDHVGPAAELPAGEGGVRALRTELGRIDGPFRARVDDGDVRGGADGERPLVESQDARWIDRVRPLVGKGVHLQRLDTGRTYDILVPRRRGRQVRERGVPRNARDMQIPRHCDHDVLR